MKMTPKFAPKSFQILQKLLLKRTHCSDSLFTSKMINESRAHAIQPIAQHQDLATRRTMVAVLQLQSLHE